MNDYFKLALLIIILLICLFMTLTGAAQNQPPVARAGNDITYPVAWNYAPWLYGTSSSDPDGWITSMHWRQVKGPNTVFISAPDANQMQLNGLTVGVYIIELKVTDNKGAVAFDSVQVTMTGTLPPVPVDTLIVDTITSVPVLLKVDSIRGAIEYINSSGIFIRTTGIKVEEVYKDNLNNVEFRVTKTITTDAFKLIDRNKYYLFLPPTQWQ